MRTDVIKVFCSIIISLHAAFAISQVEPQFKFYLAFEDVNGIKDTVWVGIDDSASTTAYDTAFGDTLVEHVNGTFQTWFYQEGNYALKTFICGSSQTSWNIDINADWPEYPMILRWDTSLLIHHDLNFELKQIYIYNSYFYLNGYPDGYDLIQPGKPDSIILEKFQIAGGDGQHFPLQLYLSKEPKHVGYEELNDVSTILFPNPTQNAFRISSHNWPIDFIIYDLMGREASRGRLKRETDAFSVSQLSRGTYIVRLNSDDESWTQRLVVD